MKEKGNLYQLLLSWSHHIDALKDWIKQNKYTCNQSVNELLTIMGQSVLRNLLAAMKNVTGPTWFSIIADEATDICNTEQLNLSIRWVSDDYKAHEDSIAFFRVPDTKSETLFSVIKDLLIRCNLPFLIAIRHSLTSSM